MTTEEVGAYVLLLCKAWCETPPGSVPDDDCVLARWTRLMPDVWLVAKVRVMAAFTRGTDGRWHQKRLRAEFAKFVKIRRQKSEAAKSRWGPKLDARALHPQCGAIEDEYGNGNEISGSFGKSENLFFGDGNVPRGTNARIASIDAFVDRLATSLFKRPAGQLPSPGEERAAWAVLKRPTAATETEEVIAGFKLLKPGEHRYFGATCLERLLENWQPVLDRLRCGATTAPNGEKARTPSDLRTIIAAKQKLREDLKAKHCSEGPLTNDWNDDKARAECAALGKEIKTLNLQLARMG